MIVGVQQLKEQVKHWKNRNKDVHFVLPRDKYSYFNLY